jgi:rubredoxin-NAD+ reductase
LSNAYAQKRAPAQLVSTPAAKMAETLNATLLPNTTVQSPDTAGHTVSVRTADGGAQTLQYRQLVLATGAQPIRIPVQGTAAAKVLSVNSLQDFSIFHTALGAHEDRASSSQNHSKTVLIMGAGLIGCEFANDLTLGGYQVHVADPSDRPLAALLPHAASLQLQQSLKDAGVQWHCGSTVNQVDTADVGYLATLSDGQQVRADLVLSAVGLRADTALATASGIACDRGILVDTQLRTSAPDVFALGDAAQYASAASRTLPYVMPIMNAAKALAATLSGSPTELAFPLMPVTVKTPALPIAIAPPAPGTTGDWVADPVPDGETGGAWRFMAEDGTQRGFALTGKQTARRMELSKLTLV